MIEAISGQDLFDRPSNIVRLLGKLATAVVASGDPMWYTGDAQTCRRKWSEVQEYVDEAHSKTVAVLPLRRPLPPPEEEDPNERTEPEPPVGALIVEQIEDSRVPASLAQRVEVVCRHSSTALANAKEHQDLFLMPVWRALGKTRVVLQTPIAADHAHRGRRGARGAVGSGAVAGQVLAGSQRHAGTGAAAKRLRAGRRRRRGLVLQAQR